MKAHDPSPGEQQLDVLLAKLPAREPGASLVAETLARVAADPGPAVPARRPRGSMHEQRSLARWTLGYAFGLAVAVAGVAVWHASGGITSKPRVLDGSAVLAASGRTGGAASAFANVRRYLDAGELPPALLVRTDAIVDYFQYTDLGDDATAPVRVGMSSIPSPWDASRRLVRLGVVGRERSWGEHTPTSLTLAVDAAAVAQSGATREMARAALGALVATLGEQDSIAILDLGRSGQIVLTSTNGGRHEVINAALDVLLVPAAEHRPVSGEAVQRAYQIAHSTSGFGRVGHVLVVGAGSLRLDTQDLRERVVSYVRNGVHTSMLTLGNTTVDAQLAELAADDVRADVRRMADMRELFLDPMMRTMLPAARDVDVQLVASSGRVRELSSATLSLLGAGQVMTALYEVEGTPDLAVRIAFRREGRASSERAEVNVADIPESSGDDDKVAAAAAAFAFALQSSDTSEAYAYLAGAESLLAGASLPALTDERNRRLELSRLVGRARELIDAE